MSVEASFFFFYITNSWPDHSYIVLKRSHSKTINLPMGIYRKGICKGRLKNRNLKIKKSRSLFILWILFLPIHI